MGPLRCSGAVLLVALLSCSGEPTAPLGPPNVVEGAWTFSAELINSDRNLVCEHYGTINVAQSGSTLSGTVRQTLECVGPSDTVFNTGTVAFTGTTGSSAIRLRFVGCDYEGDLFHAPIDSAAGDVTCDVRIRALRIPVAGQWVANIEVPPPTIAGSIIIPPGDVLVVTGETIKVVLSAHDPRGVTWVGYSLENIADSFAVHDTAFADTIAYTVPASWDGNSNLDVWARNPYHALA